MNKLFLNVSILFLVIVITSSCETKPEAKQNLSNTKDSALAFILKKDSLNKEIAFPGELIPLERAEVFAKVSAYVNTIKADIGDLVQKGQVIAVLDAPEMVANAAQANAEVQTAKAKYVGSLDVYKRIYNASKVEGTIAASEMEKAKSQMMADSTALEAAKAKLNAYTQLKDYLIIRAPFNGIVTQRNVDAGTLVGNNNTKPMLVIENNHQLRLRLPIPEAYTAASIHNTSIHFTVDAYPGVSFEAKLSRKSGSLNFSNRTEAWEFVYDNTDAKLKPGMFANSIIRFKRPVLTFIIPSSAIVTTQEKKFVIKLANEKAEWIDIRNGFALSDKTEVFGSLKEGDTIVLRGNDEIKPGKQLIPKMRN